MNIVILDDYQDSVRHLDCAVKLDQYKVSIYTSPIRGLERLSLRLRTAEILVLIYERTEITASLIKKLPKLKLIVQIGSSIEHIDVAACNQAGVAIAKGTELPEPKAEMTFTLLMNMAKRLSYYVSKFKHGAWQQSILKSQSAPHNTCLPVGLRGKNLSLLGYTNVSKLVASYAKAFNMNISFWDYDTTNLVKAQEQGWQISEDLTQIFAKADFLSVHLPYNNKTHNLISLKLLKTMKTSAGFINIENANLITPNALVTALKNSTPAIGAIDRYEVEPPSLGSNILRQENCICTPHIADVELYYYEQQFNLAFTDIINFINNKPSNIINPQTLR